MAARKADEQVGDQAEQADRGRLAPASSAAIWAATVAAIAASIGTAIAASIGTAIRNATGDNFRIADVRPVGGGCISRNYRIGDGRRTYFVKVAAGAGRQFAAEADGLAALARCEALIVPHVVAQGAGGEGGPRGEGNDDFLVLEWLDIAPPDGGSGDPARLGAALAALHGVTYPQFGWAADNFIGATPQHNAWTDDWPTFYAERRLLPQLRLAAERGAPELMAAAEPLLADLPAFFAGHRPAPSLLHGDLWSGNVGFVAGRPCLFDPAVHAGDAETDLAMSELFGGFPPAFYAGYRALRPAAAGYSRRRLLYQLYHVLNHYNLFGGGYARQAAALIARLR